MTLNIPDPANADDLYSQQLVSAEIMTVQNYFTMMQRPIYDAGEDVYIFAFSPEARELANRKVHLNLITNETYLLPE